jgi:hypothetical protein
LTDQDVHSTLQRVHAQSPSLEGLEEFEELLVPSDVPAVNLDQVRELIQQTVGATPALQAEPAFQAEPTSKPDPGMIKAAIHIAKPFEQQEEPPKSFDLTTSPPEAPVGQEFAEPEAPPHVEPPPPDEGWKSLETSTELLDHDSSHILQDMAIHARKSDVEQQLEPPAGEQEPFAAEQEPYAGEQEPYAGEQEPFAGEQEPFAGEPEATREDDLSLAALHEVISEVADERPPDQELPGREAESEAVAESFYSDLAQTYDYAEEERTDVTGSPFHPESEVDLVTEDDLFASDPDLEDEIFDDLAGSAEPPDEQASADAPIEGIPSLEDLAQHVQIPTISAEEAPAEGKTDEPEEADTELQEEPKDIKPKKSGIFRRIFGKKE